MRVTRWRRALRSAGLAVMGAGLWACQASSNDSGFANAGGAPQDRIVLPVVLSLTGQLSSIGQEHLRGARVAEQQLNALGGLFGKPLELRVFDDRSDPATAASLLSQLVEIGSPIVAGLSGSNTALALRDADPGSRLLYVTPGATSSLLTEADASRQRFFRTAPTDTALVSRLRDGTAEVEVTDTAAQPHVGCFKLQIIATDDAYGKPLSDALVAELGVTDPKGPLPTGPQIAGISLVPSELQSPKFYDEIVAREVAVRETYCQLVAAPPPIAAELLRAVARYKEQFSRSQLARSRTLASDAILSDEFLAALRNDPSNPSAGNLADGTLVLAPDLEPPGTQFNAFRGLFASQYAGQTIGRGTTSYDAVMLAGLALEVAAKQAGLDPYQVTGEQLRGLSLEQVRNAVLAVSSGGTAYGPDRLPDLLIDIRRGGVDVDYVGASGSVDETPQGEVVTGFLRYEVSGGQFVRGAALP